MIDLEQEYSDATSKATAARLGVMNAADINADMYADAQKAAQKIGIPVSSVLADPSGTKKKMALGAINFDDLAAVSPATASILADQEKAKISHDDIENMSTVETLINSFKRGVPAFKALAPSVSMLNNAEGLNRYKEIDQRIANGEDPKSVLSGYGDYGLAPLPWQTSDEALAGWNKFKSTAMRTFSSNLQSSAMDVARLNAEQNAIPLPSSVGKLNDAKTFGDAWSVFASDPMRTLAGVGPQSMLQSLPGMLAAIPSGIYAGPAGAAGAMGINSFLTDYASNITQTLQGAGVDTSDPEAMKAALADPKILTEVAKQSANHAAIVGSVDALSGGIASKIAMPKFIASKLAGKPLSRELLNIGMQAPIQGALGAAGEAGGEIYAGQELQPGQIASEFLGEFFGTPMEVVSASGKRLLEIKNQAHNTAQIAEQLNQAAAASKVLQRSPETFQEFVKSASEDGPVDQVFIDAKTLMQSGVGEDVAMASPSVAAQLPQALQTGGQVSIPIDEYMTHIAPKEFAQSLVDHVKFNPEDFSRAEAQQYESEHGEALRADIERLATESTGDQVFKQSADNVRSIVQSELDRAGRWTPDVNKMYASLVGSYYATQAAKLGFMPEELYKQYPLKVISTLSDGARFNQSDLKGVNGTTTDTADITGKGGTASLTDTSDSIIDNKPNELHQRAGSHDSPIIELNGDEVGAHDADIKTLREAAKAYYEKNLIGTSVTNPQLGEINFAKRGLKKAMATSANPLKLRLISAIPKILENGVVVRTQENNSPDTHTNIARYHWIRGDVSIGGERHSVEIAVEEKHDGKFYYNHSLPGKEYFQDSGVQAHNPSRPAANNSTERQSIEAERNHRSIDRESPDKNIAEGDDNINLQVENKTARGSFSPDTLTVSLLQKADLSTFLHETGHFFLHMQMDLASRITPDTEGAKQYLADTDAILKWFGIKSVDEWHSLDFEEQRDYHEQFARGFEAYLFEGKAPSIELQSVFQRYRAWLLNIYKKLKNLDVELSNEVRGVFDRMLAANDEIVMAEQSRRMLPLFNKFDEKIMTPQEWQAYQKKNIDATSDAVDSLQSKSVRDMQWLSARGLFLAEMKKKAKSLRAAVKSDMHAEMMKEPIYRAYRLFTSTGTEESTENPMGLSSARMSLDQLREMDLPDHIVDKLRSRKMTGKNSIDLDFVADHFGFNSGNELARALADVIAPRDELLSRTNAEMLARHSELATQEEIEKAVDRSLYNDSRILFSTTEANLLAKATGRMKVMRSAAQQMADTSISKLLVRNLRPSQFTAAEAKAARAAQNAVMSNDLDKAADEARNRLYNQLAAKSAMKAQDEVENGVAKMKRLQSAAAQKAMRGDMLAQLNNLLARFDLRTGQSLKLIDETRQPLSDWIKAESDRISAVVPELPDFVLNEGYKKHYKDLSVDQFRQLMDTVKQLENLAKREEKQYQAIRNQSFSQEKIAVLEAIRKNFPHAFDEDGKPLDMQPDFVPTLSKAMKNIGDKSIGEFISSENIIDLLERGKMGPVWESLFGRLTHASDQKAELLGEIYKEIQPVFDAYSLAERLSFSRKAIHVPEIETSVTRENAVMVALLHGNPEGRERLMNYGWDQGQQRAIISHLNDKDLNLVEAIWKLFDYKLWPKMEDLNNRTRGKAPVKVQAAPYDINGRQMSGGYMRLKYDGDLDERAHNLDEGAAVKELLGGGMGMSSKTNQGTSTDRKQGVKLRPRLDMGVFSETISETVHDLAFREAIADTIRMLRDKGIMNAIKSAQGVPAYRALVSHVRDTASPPRSTSGWIETTANIARKNTVINMMSGVPTALQNFTGLFPAMAKVNPIALIAETLKFFTPSMMNRTSFVMEQSAYMRHRSESFDRDLSDMAKKLTIGGRIMPSDSAYLWLMSQVDKAVAMPIWMQAFKEGMKQFNNDNGMATDYADRIVRQTQGSGREVDLASIMTGHGAWGKLKRVFTMFYSYFNGQLGLLVTTGAVSKTLAKEHPIKAVAQFTANFIYIMVIPTVLTELLMNGFGDDNEDKKRKWALAIARYHFGMLPVGRDVFAGAVSHYLPDQKSHAGFKLSPLESGIDVAIQAPGAMYKLAHGSDKDSDIKTAIMGANEVAGLPGKLISDTVLGTRAFMNGKAGPQAVVFGPPKKK